MSIKSSLFYFLVPFLLFAAEQTRNVNPFTAINAQGNYTLWLEESSTPSLKLEGSENALENIESSVTSNTLMIKPKTSGYSNEKVQIYVGVKNLSELTASGSVTITTQNQIQSDTLSFHAGGQIMGNLDLKLRQLNLTLSGSSKLKLTGTTDTQSIHVSGQSMIDASNFTSRSTKINASGSSKISVNATSDLSVTASGDSTISYKSNPKIKSQLSGSAKLKPLKEKP